MLHSDLFFSPPCKDITVCAAMSAIMKLFTWALLPALLSSSHVAKRQELSAASSVALSLCDSSPVTLRSLNYTCISGTPYATIATPTGLLSGISTTGSSTAEETSTRVAQPSMSGSVSGSPFTDVPTGFGRLTQTPIASRANSSSMIPQTSGSEGLSSPSTFPSQPTSNSTAVTPGGIPSPVANNPSTASGAPTSDTRNASSIASPSGASPTITESTTLDVSTGTSSDTSATGSS
ncbi:hypothetical protein K458DRAFT_450376 [Lentithecium fluviatile CBS 122367]|uniref:Uncharacterized protein n=1 Tax=Lentithecium fluviatile CBS 122367 TaxID=1168545 RepID=A0A6G1J5G7_9PLEO|nr:hypothetical protein K458DRAFT_450376 [Lentithecium fluviatile CBS 122367]